MNDRFLEQKLIDQERALLEQRKQTNGALQQLYTDIGVVKQEMHKIATTARRNGYMTVITLVLQLILMGFIIGRSTSPIQTITAWFTPAPCPALEVHL